MEKFIITLFKCTLSMSIITLLYAAVLPILSKRYAAKWLYIVWLVIAASWIIPFRPLIEIPFLPAPSSDIMSIPSPITPTSSEGVLTAAQKTVLSTQQISLWNVIALIWMAGVVFMLTYHVLRHRRFMKMVNRWSELETTPNILNLVDSLKREQSIKTKIEYRSCECVSSPMLVGLFHPVILMPPVQLSEEEFTLILKHELTHFKRHDLWYKAIILIATVLHWFNPVIYFMARAISIQCEISCDALVLRNANIHTRKRYGKAIITVVRNGRMHQTILSTNFYGGKRGIKKRIEFMLDGKRKRTGIAVLCIALAGIMLTGATLVHGKNKPMMISDSSFSEEEYGQLLALQFDGYKDMSVAEFQEKVWTTIDTIEYRELLEGFFQDERLYELRDTNEIAGFLYNILGPLTGQRWGRENFIYMALSNSGEDHEKAMLEYDMEFRIRDAENLKVGEYDNARREIKSAMERLIDGKTDEILQDAQAMKKILQSETEKLANQWSTEKLQIQISYSFLPLSVDTLEQPNFIEEIRKTYGTEEDYRSLLKLKTEDYQSRTVADFNADLLNWANEDYDRMERIGIDTARNNFVVSLSPEELSFVTVTVNYSGLENAALIKSHQTGEPKGDIEFSVSLPEKTLEQEGITSAWCSLYYQGSYRIKDDSHMTVGERDRCVGGVINGIQEYWNQIDFEELLILDEKDVLANMESIAAKYSNDSITISILPDSLAFDKMDERGNN